MRGTQDGAPLPGPPAATGGTLDLAGLDVLTTEGGRLVNVVGYFDQQGLLEQLGLRTVVVPADSWPVRHGSSTRLDLARTTVPGALTMTWTEVEPAEQGQLIARSTKIITALASDPGFIALQATTVGTRSTTLALWTSPQAAEAAIARNAPHTAAREQVLGSGFTSGGYASIWQPGGQIRRTRAAAAGPG